MKENRKLPSMDRHTIGPPADIPILKYYEGIFDTVFVSLNPFAQILDSSNYTLENFWEEDLNETWKQHLLKNTNPVTWKNIVEISSLKNINEIDIALRTSILGLNLDKQNYELESLLESTLEKSQNISPVEGRIPHGNINFILKAIKSLNYEWICIGSEFGDYMELVWIDDLINDVKELTLQTNLYTYDRKILITCHWDSFQTYICSSCEIVEKIVQHANLEGFYANANTEVYWSLRNEQFG